MHAGRLRFSYEFASVNSTRMQIINEIKDILSRARQNAYRSVNKAMVEAYWLIGKRIIEEEQGGSKRARYGKSLIKSLSRQLQNEFGKGFSERNLEQMRVFYRRYPIPQKTSAELEQVSGVGYNASPGNLQVPEFHLSWSHYQMLLKIESEDERKFYEIEAAKNNWSLRELKRQYDSALYLRLALSTDKEGIKSLATMGQTIESPKDAIKDPYILEFLNLKEHHQYSESTLESELINKLEHFLSELGNGFTFLARQKRITIDDKHFYIDLVFYNRLLRSFVVIDLKIGELTHQDIGQVQMYVNYYDRFIRSEEESKTIGIILCQSKSNVLVEITLPEDNKQIFASRYQTILPSKEQLRRLLSA